MTQYNTRNPIGSTDPRDLLDNAQNIDDAVNSSDATWVDRFGDSRPTLRSIEQAFDDALRSTGYEFLSDYSSGITVTKYNQLIMESGQFWRASASTPLPYTTTGTGMPEGGAFVSVGDGYLRGELVQPVATYNSVLAMQSDVTLTVGRKCRTLGYYTPGDGGGNDYEIVSGGTGSVDGGSFISLSAVGLQAKGLFLNNMIYVKQFGARGDDLDQTGQFNAAATYANSLATDGGSNRSPMVHCKGGKFRITSTTTSKCTWVIYQDAYITGLPGIEPSFAEDLSRLTGTVIRYSGVDQFGTVSYGDGNLTVQKYSGKAVTGEVSGHSDNAAAGLAGSSYASANNDDNQSCIGIFGSVLGDNDTSPRNAWSLYLEGHRTPTSLGNVFCTEATTFNRGNYVSDTPNENVSAPVKGLTYNQWYTTGGSQLDFPDCNDSTAAIGILGKGGAKYGRGIIIKKDSIATLEAMSMPALHDVCWYGGTGLSATSTQKTASVSANAPNSTGDGQITFKVNCQSVGLTRGFYITKSQLAPLVDNTTSLGNALNRYTDIYATNSVIQTSDGRLKQDVYDLDDKERRVAIKVKGLIKKFRFTDAIELKGDRARYHFGVIAQDVAAAFESEGLDPFDYGAICYDEWSESVDESGNVTPAGSRYSVRYEELLCFVISSI